MADELWLWATCGLICGSCVMSMQLAQLEQQDDDEDDEDLASLERELQALAALEGVSMEELATDENLTILSQYLDAAEQEVARAEAEKAELAAAVARGEASADALANTLEDMPDVDAELLADFGEEDVDTVAALDDEDDGEQWVERIIEMTRVTKVSCCNRELGECCCSAINSRDLCGMLLPDVDS